VRGESVSFSEVARIAQKLRFQAEKFKIRGLFSHVVRVPWEIVST